MSRRVMIAVDAGNSSIKLASMDPARTNEATNITARRIALSSRDFESQLADFASALPATEPEVCWLIASVNAAGVDRLRRWIERHRGCDRVYQIDRQHIAITADVRFPERVGIDRLLGAGNLPIVGCKQRALVIDAGTSITVDWVDDAGVFEAGQFCRELDCSPGRCTKQRATRSPPPSLSQLESPGRTQAAMYLGVARA
ncbi:MAG: type III pantothenate kinase [Pirellulaceae bacterium]